MPTTFKDTLVPIIFPEWAKQLGFQDCSWHNDAAARAELPLPRLPKDLPINACAVELWVAAEKPEDREWPEFPRFMAAVYRYDVDEEHVTDFLFHLYQGESPERCGQMLDMFMTMWNHRI